MEKHKLIDLNEDTLEKIRKSYNMDDKKRREEAIGALRSWVQKQDHLIKKNYTDRYLEWRILTSKGSVERAKTMIDKICTFRTLYPQLFGVYNVKEDFGNLSDNVIVFALPKVLNEDIRVYVVKFFDKEPISKFFMNYLRYILVMCEYLAAHDYLEKVCVIYDLREANLASFVSDMDFIEMKREITALLEGYGVRPQNILIMTKSKVVETLLSIVKTFLKPKIIQRIQVIKSHEELHEFVPREMLPEDYGGKEPSLNETQDLWTRVLSSEYTMDILRAAYEARTDETRRRTGQFSEQYAGVAGTFRYLNVD
ncbi:uncharacterized protein LOC121728132 [Aricia agestis]|uniref:uncharacterized protein LOC121728132 n=1 Tax=Aricia agestis TaxID=91739 RepID=UPI001C20202B|nr:uncharacterized protein LOC121728132 [Aricia agestis]